MYLKILIQTLINQYHTLRSNYLKTVDEHSNNMRIVNDENKELKYHLACRTSKEKDVVMELHKNIWNVEFELCRETKMKTSVRTI